MMNEYAEPSEPEISKGSFLLVPGSRTQQIILDRIEKLLHQRLVIDSGIKVKDGAVRELALEVWQETRRPA